MYACVCDWLGFPYREEVQWVSNKLLLGGLHFQFTVCVYTLYKIYTLKIDSSYTTVKNNKNI